MTIISSVGEDGELAEVHGTNSLGKDLAYLDIWRRISPKIQDSHFPRER